MCGRRGKQRLSLHKLPVTGDKSKLHVISCKLSVEDGEAGSALTQVTRYRLQLTMERRGVEIEHALGLIKADRACIRYVREPSMREHHQHLMQVPKRRVLSSTKFRLNGLKLPEWQRSKAPSAKR